MRWQAGATRNVLRYQQLWGLKVIDRDNFATVKMASTCILGDLSLNGAVYKPLADARREAGLPE